MSLMPVTSRQDKGLSARGAAADMGEGQAVGRVRGFKKAISVEQQLRQQQQEKPSAQLQ